MRLFDFTKTGGFPLSQDRLAWMQQGYLDALTALGGICGAQTPVILSGCVGTYSGSGLSQTLTVTNGWLWEPTLGVMPFVGGTVSNPKMYNVQFAELKTPLTFANNANQLVQIQRVAQMSTLANPNGVNWSVSQFLDLKWHKEFQKLGRDQGWTVLSGGAAGAQVDLYFKKDLNSILKIRGTVNVPANISMPYTIAPFATPAGFAPQAGVDADFLGVVRYVSNAYPINSTTGNAINAITGRITNTNILLELAPSGTPYTARINTVINLD